MIGTATDSHVTKSISVMRVTNRQQTEPRDGGNVFTPEVTGAARPPRTDIFGASMAGNVMLPGENARIATTTFDDWLSAGTQ